MSFCARPIRAASRRRRGADSGDDGHRVGREAEEHVAAGHHVDASRDHRRGVDEGRHRSRTRHRVGQPDVERHLGALADGAEEEAEGDEREGRREAAGLGRGRRGRRRRSRACRTRPPRPNIPRRKPQSPMRLTTKAFLPAAGAFGLLVVIADQEIRAESDALPADEHQQEVLGEHQDEHREHEEVQVREEARVPGVGLVVVHVADRVDVDQEPDERHERGHERRERVEAEGDVRREVAGVDPLGGPLDDRRVVAREVRQQPRVGDEGREPDGPDADDADEPLAELRAEEAVDEEAGERQRRDEPERERRAHLTT